ncbi:phosphotransferase [Mycobacterium sp. E802]|uniref:phosphotransferase n=1 Tax=Mycobacterium sp. E802 TaxID=1834152 RepID=UPI0009EE9671|nr:phosphotransferase [Mycobacterium sp. E802]
MSDELERLERWVETALGGRVLGSRRLARWRPAWDIDVEIGHRRVALHARGEREPRIVMPYRIADEVATHRLLQAHQIPVPHAYGLCDQPYALVMDRLPGQADLSNVPAGDRDRLLDSYLQILARIYQIPLSDAEAAGFQIPTDSAEACLAGYWRRTEDLYDAAMAGHDPDPLAVFLRRWINDHVPADRHQHARFITYDSFQFMFDGTQITGLLDFEHAHVGDPLMDLAALRIRDTIKNIGELPHYADRYRQITGLEIDHDAVEFHTVVYNAISVLSVGPPLRDPMPGTDWLTYLAWYVNGARWALECIAEIGGYRLEPVQIPQPRPTKHAVALRHLVAGLRDASYEPAEADYQRVALGRIANHLKRVDEIGAELDTAELDDLAEVLGSRPRPEDADAELIRLINDAGPDREEVLVRLLDRRAQRCHLSMASASSLMLRHPPLRSLRPERTVTRSLDDGWPGGAIPGTA